jgi:hypothetical protein
MEERARFATEYESGECTMAELCRRVLVRVVYSSGEFFWKQKCIFISKVLAGERIGLEQIDDRLWCILFASFPIAYFDSQQLTVGPLP